jgi:hypothetical protein
VRHTRIVGGGGRKQYFRLEGSQATKFNPTLGRNFSVTIGRAAWEACSATWNLGTNSAFALGPRKTTDLPDAN